MRKSATTSKKPWNRTNLPVYSIASVSAEGMANMNICTYATAVSMQPKRFAVAIYKGTRTLLNVQQTQKMGLQLLGVQHLPLVRRLGKTSALKKDKMKSLLKQCKQENGLYILNDLPAVIYLQVISWTDAGDHLLALCDVMAYKNYNDAPLLMLDDLRTAKIISV